MNHESKRPITVEDLLRLKRAERPPAEFWDNFDRELRAKQLAALVEKSPWWRTLPRAFAGFSRYSLPIGATAVLALTFVATRDYHAGPVPVGTSDEAQVAASVAAGAEQQLAKNEALVQIAAATRPALAFDSRSEKASVESSYTYQDRFAVAAELGAETYQDEMDDASVTESISPSARHIAANLAVAQASAPALTRGLLGATRSVEDRAQIARNTVEPLAQVSTPAERSRARFATAMVASFSGDTRGRASSANVARRISDERVYDDDAIRRVGATGNSVAWRF